jgi:uncharacterized membrane protein YgcG
MTGTLCHKLTLTAISLALAIASRAMAQGAPPAPPTAASTPAASGQDQPPLSQQELDQILAPLALYPDSLLSQIFMASTYPLEVVEAERWMKANASLKGDALTKALEAKTWDASVKSLVNFPDILAMMSEKLDMTVKLGDAFIAQQKQVMDTVQTLRSKAKQQGNLESNQQQTVKVEPAAAGSQTQTIIIEPADPQVVYVPQYNPTVVYGSWPYPAYPPYPYYPPGYVASNVLSFGVGMAVGAAWGYAWGHCNWGGGDVDIDVNRNTNINNNIDRSKYKNDMQRKGATNQAGKGSFKHDSSHRQGAPYRDSKTAQQFGGSSAAQAKQSRDAYRGRAETGRQDIARGGADQARGGATNRPSTPASPSASNRPTANTGAGAGNRQAPASAGTRPAPTSSNRGNAFAGSSGSGSGARSASNRGSTSRSSSGGGSRGGGGGGRGGGRR